MSLPTVKTVQTACNYVAKKFSGARGGKGVFLQDLYDSAKVIDVKLDSDGTAAVYFEVFTDSKLKNNMKMVHGGASSSIIALFSVLSLAADRKYWKDLDNPTEEELEAFSNDLGVTRSMDVQIIQAVPLRTNVVVKCHLLSNTKSNSFISGGIYNTSGKLLVSAFHDLMKKSPASSNPQDPLDLKASFKPESKI